LVEISKDTDGSLAISRSLAASQGHVPARSEAFHTRG
jgi:hypothetical protein